MIKMSTDALKLGVDVLTNSWGNFQVMTSDLHIHIDLLSSKRFMNTMLDVALIFQCIELLQEIKPATK